MARGFRAFIGFPIFLIGLYFAFVSIHLLLNSEAAFVRVLVGGGLGLVMATTGGYIMSEAIAEKIVSGVVKHLLPFLNLRPGGKRFTDPPPLDP